MMLFSFYGISQQVSENTARTVAKNFLAEKQYSGFKKNTSEIAFEKATGKTSQNNYYIFNTENQQGFVIVSANKKAYPILAYSLKNNFPTADMPPEVAEWLDIYNLQIEKLNTLKISPQKKILLAWDKYASETFNPANNTLKEAALTDVPPLISTTWNQGNYYNALCPETSTGGSGGHVWAGCVAVAMAQLMKYWDYPVNGQGNHSYVHYVYGEQSADFQNTTYNWGNMPNALSSHNIDVATLIYHCGVSVNMDYSPSGSGAYSSTARTSLINYFKYSSNTLLTWKSSYSEENWKRMIRSEIDAGRPLYYAGYGTGGHAFNCDGYQGTDYFHFNWGWGGAYNGYFYLNDLTPGGNNFSNSQSVMVGLTPANLEPDFDSIAAVELFCSTPYSGTTVDGTNSANIYSINNLHETGKEKLHKITTLFPGRITAKLSGLNADLDVLILKYANRESALAYGDSIAFLDDAEPGTYYIVVDGNYAAEGAYTLEVICPDNKADITVDEAFVESMYVEPGQEFKIRCRINNIGNSNAGRNVLKFYFSNDKTYSSDDIFIDSLIIDTLLQKSSLDISKKLNLPLIDTSGLNYIILYADANEEVLETDDELNFANAYVQIPKKGLMDCSLAINLQDNVLYSGDAHLFGDSVIDNYNCYPGLTNKEVIHSFTPEFSGMLSMEFSESLEGNTMLILLSGCNENTCINTFSIWEPQDTTITQRFYVTGGHTYYLVVDGNDNNGNTEGAYSIKLNYPKECPEPIINSPAQINKCDSDYAAYLYTDWGYPNYQWMKDSVDISGANSTGYSAGESGVYQVKVTENGCTAISEGVQVRYSPRPSNATISALSDTSFCEGGSVILQLSTDTGYTYLWTQNDVPISGAEYLDYEAFESGTYRAEVTNISCTIKSNPINVLAFHSAKQNGDVLEMNKDSLISWWTFTNWGIDESGKENYANIYNAFQTEDHLGGFTAFLFNGKNSYISTRNEFAHPDTFTLSLWFKTAGAGKLIGFDNQQFTGTSTNFDRHLYLDNNGHVYFGVDNGTKKVISTDSTFNDNQWHMLTASLSPNGMKLYVDAKLLAEDTSVISGAFYSGHWKMAYGSLSGWENNPNKEYFEGKLDDIAIYKRALNIDEIEVLYNEQKIKIYAEQNVICATTGSTNIVIENSEPHVEYQLIKSADSSLVGSQVSGTSGIIYLNTGTLNETTDFKIFALNSNTSCSTFLDSVYTVHINTNVHPTIEIFTNKNEACEGDTIEVSANLQFGGNNPNFQWQINGVNAGTDTSIFISNTLSDKDELKLYLTSSLDCALPKTVLSDSIVFKIHSLPDNSLTINGSLDICEGDSTILSANANADYEWYLIGEAYHLDTTQSLTIEHAGMYYVKLENQYGCVRFSDTLEFDTYPLPQINIGKDTSIFTNQSVTIGTDEHFMSYQWNTGSIEPKITVDGSIGLGEHEYWLKVTDDYCSNTDTIIVNIEQITGLKQSFSDTEIKVYPNPAQEFIYIEFGNILRSNLIIEMRNSAGMLVWHKVYKQNTSFIKDKISVNNYPKGVYFLNFMNENKNLVHKIIIE